MDDVGDTGAGSTDRELVGTAVELAALKIVNQGLKFGFVSNRNSTLLLVVKRR